MAAGRSENADLGYRPRAWQLELHAARRFRFRVCVVHRQGGKSEAACMELIDAALKAKGDLPRFAYVSPELKLAIQMFWPKLKKRLEPLIKLGTVIVNEGNHKVSFKHNDATIEMFGASDPESLRGHTMRGVVLDEVGQMKSKVWGSLIEPWIMHNLGWALFIGTPAGINLFSELFTRGGDPQYPDWWSRRWTVYETNALPAAEVKRKEEETSENEWAREFLCDFQAQSNQQLISLALAETAARRVWKPDDPAILSAPLVIGVDPARFGDDRSVIVLRRGLFMFPPLVFKGVDTMFLAQRTALEINQHKPAAVFVDGGGVGAGVIDRLRQLGHTVQEVQFGSKSPIKGFMNMRAFMWWKMKEWLENGGGIPNDPVLIRELATPTYGFNGKGDVVLESKDDIKERLDTGDDSGGSPDIADACATTFAAPVQPPPAFGDSRFKPNLGPPGGGRYDPFDMKKHMGKDPFKR